MLLLLLSSGGGGEEEEDVHSTRAIVVIRRLMEEEEERSISDKKCAIERIGTHDQHQTQEKTRDSPRYLLNGMNGWMATRRATDRRSTH